MSGPIRLPRPPGTAYLRFCDRSQEGRLLAAPWLAACDRKLLPSVARWRTSEHEFLLVLSRSERHTVAQAESWDALRRMVLPTLFAEASALLMDGDALHMDFFLSDFHRALARNLLRREPRAAAAQAGVTPVPIRGGT